MRWILVALLVVHGIAHMPGFLVDWKLWQTAELPYRTTLFGGVLEVGDGGTRILGAGWLLAAIACAGAAVMIALDQSRSWAWAAVALSTILCLIGLPEARMGLLINGMLVLGLIFL